MSRSLLAAHFIKIAPVWEWCVLPPLALFSRNINYRHILEYALRHEKIYKYFHWFILLLSFFNSEIFLSLPKVSAHCVMCSLSLSLSSKEPIRKCHVPKSDSWSRPILKTRRQSGNVPVSARLANHRNRIPTATMRSVCSPTFPHIQKAMSKDFMAPVAHMEVSINTTPRLFLRFYHLYLFSCSPAAFSKRNISDMNVPPFLHWNIQ